MSGRVLDLNSQEIEIEKWSFNESAEFSVCKHYLRLLRVRFQQILISEDFTALRVREEIPVLVQEVRSEALRNAVEDAEAGWRKCWHRKSDGDQVAYENRHKLLYLIEPDHEKLEQTLVGGVEGLLQPDEFVEAVSARISEQLEGASFLEELESHQQHPLMRNVILPLIRELEPMSQDFEQDGMTETIHAFVQEKLEQGNVSIDPDDPQLAYFLLFLPPRLRYPIQELLIHSMFLNYLEKQKVGKDEAVIAFIDHLQDYFRRGVVSNSHWERLIRWYKASSDFVLEFGVREREVRELLLRIVTLAGEGGNREVLEALCSFSSRMIDVVGRCDSKGGSIWELTDLGHGFKNEAVGPLQDCLRGDERFIFPPEKCGRRCVILEDDPAQMRAYAETLEKWSPYDLAGDEAQCMKPEDVEPFIDDPEVEYFLLDIENEEDRTAGIRLATQIVERKFSEYEHMEEYELRQQPRIVIQVWTSSIDLYEQAEQAFRELNDRCYQRNRYVVEGISSSSHVPPVKLHLALKTSPLTFRRDWD